MLPLQRNWGCFIGSFTDTPINTSAHYVWSHCTHRIASHSILCTTIIYNITKGVYYSRHIPGISTRHHHIPDIFQCRNQYRVKSKEMAISVPTRTQPDIPVSLLHWSPMFLTHIWGHCVLPLNRTGHICVYLLLPYPGCSQSITRTSFP